MDSVRRSWFLLFSVEVYGSCVFLVAVGCFVILYSPICLLFRCMTTPFLPPKSTMCRFAWLVLRMMEHTQLGLRSRDRMSWFVVFFVPSEPFDLGWSIKNLFGLCLLQMKYSRGVSIFSCCMLLT